MAETFYRRPLPAETIAFSSPEGRRVFAEALAAGGLDGYFPLAEQFHTQADPAYCGLGSLVVALNALAIDPGRLWKGPWRWFGEELLDCCVPLEQVRARGLHLDELSCLAQCNGAEVVVERADAADAPRLRDALATASRGEGVVIAAYDRATLGQTGSGHFSPVGGYHAARDLALVLDVARFKYPPHWVPVERLHEAMRPLDPATGKARGWLRLRARPHVSAIGFTFRCGRESLGALGDRVDALVNDLASATDIADAARRIAPVADSLEVRTPGVAAHGEALARARDALADTPVHAEVAREVGADRAEVAALLLLAIVDLLPSAARVRLGALIGPVAGEGALTAEVGQLRVQLAALLGYARGLARRG